MSSPMEPKRIDMHQAAAKLAAADGILVVCHKCPDGDAWGSAFALCGALLSLGKRAAVAGASELPALYAYLRPLAGGLPGEPGLVVSVDCSTLERLLVPQTAVDLSIDHHSAASLYAAETFCRPESASCAELVLGIIDLVSRVGQDTLPAYLVKYNNQAALPETEAAGYWNMICAAFNVCGGSGAFGGALGMVLGWPAWTFLGTALGTVALGAVCAACVLLVSRFDMIQMFESVRDGWQARQQHIQQQRAQREYQEQLEDQRQQEQEDDRRMISPAFRRKNDAQPPMQEAPVYPPYGSMLMQQPPMPQGGMPVYPYGMPPAYPAPVQPPAQPQGEIYDELIIPEGRQLPWRKAEGKGKKEKKEKQYQTRMTFTPSEMGADTAETPLPDTLIMSASKRKAMDRIEEIRRRKAEIAASMGEAAVVPPQMAPTPIVPVAPEQAQSSPPAAQQPPPASQPHQAAPQPAQAETVEDRNAAYKRPAGQPRPTPPASEPRPVERTPYAYPSIDLLNTQQRRAATDTRAQDTADATRL